MLFISKVPTVSVWHCIYQEWWVNISILLVSYVSKQCSSHSVLAILSYWFIRGPSASSLCKHWPHAVLFPKSLLYQSRKDYLQEWWVNRSIFLVKQLCLECGSHSAAILTYCSSGGHQHLSHVHIESCYCRTIGLKMGDCTLNLNQSIRKELCL